MKFAIFGLSRTGMATLKYLKKDSNTVYAINEGEPNTWPNINRIKEFLDPEYIINETKAYDIIKTVDYIILSPGIPRTHLLLKEIDSKKIISDIELLYPKIKNIPIIAITGTNGKTTVTTLLDSILRDQGFKVFTGGNIGNAVANISDDSYDYILLELSSFQLESINLFRPHMAIILNISPSHGERYSNFNDYRNAKFNIFKNMQQNDYLIYDSKLPLTSNATQIPITYDSSKFLLDDTKLNIIGEHNKINLTFILEVCKILKLNSTLYLKSIYDFKGVEFRVQKVPCNFGFIAINDAKSTNFEATTTAIKSVQSSFGKEIFLILGGKERGNMDDPTPYLSFFKQTVSKLILIGETTDKYFKIFDNNIPTICSYTLQNAVDFAKNNCNGVLLFSPGLPSFDQFTSYIERGNLFNKLVSR